MSLKVALSTWSKFHFFHLAREMERAGVLSQVFMNLPRWRVGDEGVPAAKIEANVFPAIMRYGLMRYAIALPRPLDRGLTRWVDSSQQRFVARRLGEADALVALSGAGLGGGRAIQRRGGVFVCERASTHISWVERELSEEYRRFGLPPLRIDPWLVEKELAEYAESDAVVVPSRFVRRTFVEHGVPASKITVNPYGVSLATFGRDQVVRDDDEFRVAFVGQISLRKGVPYLLEAFRRVRHPKKRLTLIGVVQRDMAGLMDRFPLDGVEFAGRATRAEIRRALNRSDAFCIASIEEGMAVVSGEALACGLPVVATENSGAGEIVSDGVEGFVTPARDAAVLADRLQNLADDPALRARMSAAALAKAGSLGGWGQYGDRYLDLLSRLTGKGLEPGV